MKIHEYQGKELLRNFDVPVPRGYPAFTTLEALEAAQRLGGKVWVVKAQIHAGGRGKGGGVKLARSLDELKTLTIFSGVSWATFSMSMPPSLEPMIATFCVARSVSTAT